MSKPDCFRSCDVVGELVVAHLLRGDVLLLEVAGLLFDLGEGGDGEGLVAGDGFAGEGALPAVVEDPVVDLRVPAGGGGEDAALQGEGGGVEFEDGEVGERVGLGVEVLVVEDAGGFAGVVGLAGDPLAVGAGEGLGGLVLDDGEESFLAAVGGGEVELVEGEEAGGDEHGDDEDGRDDAVEADAAGLHRGELGGAIECAEGDEHGDERAEGSDVVEDVGDEVDEVLADGDQGRAVAEDGADELEEGEDEEECGEGEEDDGEVGGVLAHDVVVEQERELDAGDAAEAAEEGGDVVVGAARRRIACR